MSAAPAHRPPRSFPTGPTGLLKLLSLLAALALVLVPTMRALDSGPARTVELAAAGTNPVTPGDFAGYGFDQCLAPSQAAMDKWLKASPFLAVGIYISGNSRGCRNQPNLTSTWVRTQLARGWKLLPITLGPQASCNPRYPRYRDDPTIRSTPGANGDYDAARTQARAEAKKTVAAASALGIVRGSTLWYDLESFDIKRTACRDSALAFLSTYTNTLHKLGYVSGVYSSAGSGIVAMDAARRARMKSFSAPDQIWIARWDGRANTSTTYISDAGWNPGNRIKQYQGGHNETWGRVTINIDRDYLDLGRGAYAAPSRPCAGVRVNFMTFPVLTAANASRFPLQTKALQCLLRVAGSYQGKLDGTYDAATIAAVQRWSTDHGLTADATGQTSRRTWIALIAAGTHPVLKIGSAGDAVRRLQRALDAALPDARLKVTGIYDTATRDAVKKYQARVGMPTSGIVTAGSWTRLRQGRN